MNEIQVELPESVRTFVDEQVAAGGYGSASEYIRELIRQAQKQAAEARLEEMLLEGVRSGPGRPVSREEWDRKTAQLLEEHKRKSAG
jgi:antitoxin ParD1/3/4